MHIVLNIIQGFRRVFDILTEITNIANEIINDKEINLDYKLFPKLRMIQIIP